MDGSGSGKRGGGRRPAFAGLFKRRHGVAFVSCGCGWNLVWIDGIERIDRLGRGQRWGLGGIDGTERLDDHGRIGWVGPRWIGGRWSRR